MQKTHDPYAALRVRDYRLFLAMRLFITLGVQIMSVSVGYFVYDLTHDPLALGLIGLAEAVPAIGVSLYAGHLADKINRRSIILACSLNITVCAIALLLLALNRHHLSTAVLLAGIYGVTVLSGVGRGFFSPANFSFLPQLVDRSILPNAISWNSSAWQTANITGLGLGGLLYGFAGVDATFAAMAVLCASGVVCVLQIAPRPVPPAIHAEKALARIREGIRFVFNNQLILSAIALDLFAVLFGGAVALLPIYAKDILQVGPEGLGILRAAMALGAITMAFVLAHRTPGANAGYQLLWCVAGFGVCIIAFGLSRSFLLSFICLYLAGVLDEVSVFIRASLVQHLTPDHMKGRVSSVNSIFITSSNEIGSFESGVAAKLLGTVPAVVFGGVMTLVVVGIAWWRAPTLRQLDFRKMTEEANAAAP